MPSKVAISTLNASTYDILNTIRANAPYDYQNQIPVVSVEKDIPIVGQIMKGYPALANHFVNELINRIAIVKAKSMFFNNPYRDLKKGFLEYGETIEDIFVGIAKAYAYDIEKTPEREFKRTLPEVAASFYAINWSVVYPATIQENDLQKAFLSLSGVQSFIAKIVDGVYNGGEYDEYLLFKYMLIKSITSGQMCPIASGDGSDLNDDAAKFRGTSNLLTFPSTRYNEEGVRNSTPRDRQQIFMAADYEAQFSVEVLADAFNMEKAEFMGKLRLIDDWTTFDNDRFLSIQADTNMIPAVTDAELNLMKDVVAVIVDSEWFQVYDNKFKFTVKYAASGDYWNYFLHIQKTIAHSPYANAVVIVRSDADINLPENITLEISAKTIDEIGTTITLTPDYEGASLSRSNLSFIQTETAVQNGVAVHEYGAYVFPANADSVDISANIGDTIYVAMTSGQTPVKAELETTDEVGTTFTLVKQ